MMSDRKVIRLKVKELMKAQVEMDVPTDAALAQMVGVSTTQVWRAKLPPTDKRHNTPGVQFIAGVLSAFNEPFEKFFYVADVTEDQLQKEQ